MSYTKSESLLNDLSNKPTFVKIRRRIEEFWSHPFLICPGLLKKLHHSRATPSFVEYIILSVVKTEFACNSE
jgi:hypothetical protein